MDYRLEILMTCYEVKIQHTEKTFEALAHMQYDLFCQKNRLSRTLVSVAFISAGILNFSEWWGILLAAYGCYMTTSTYSSSNHTAHKLSAQIKESGMPFPASRFVFRPDDMEIYSLPKNYREGSLPYADILRLGEDREYFYLFRDQFGGYMVPKEELGNRAPVFKAFLEEKTGKTFRMRTIPVLRFVEWVKKKKR